MGYYYGVTVLGMRGSFAIQAKRVIIALLLNLWINFLYPRDISTNLRGLDYISVLDRAIIGCLVESTKGGSSHDI